MRLIFTAATAALLFAGSTLAQPATNPTASNPNVTTPAPVPAPNRNTVTTRDTANPPAATNNTRATANPALKTQEGNNPGAPVAGANSFTEGQAKVRIEARGYTNVSDLTKDSQGIWRGKASKDGKTFDVSLDYQGNVVSR